jgi:hypothetical protein
MECAQSSEQVAKIKRYVVTYTGVLCLALSLYCPQTFLLLRVNIVTYRPTAGQRLDKHGPAKRDPW